MTFAKRWCLGQTMGWCRWKGSSVVSGKPRPRSRSRLPNPSVGHPARIRVDEQEELLLFRNLVRQVGPHIPGSGHRVFLLHPNVKWGPRKKINTTVDLQLAEAVSLVDTLMSWQVVDQLVVSVKHPQIKLVFGSGNFQLVKEKILEARFKSGATAVFLNVQKLTGLQHFTLEMELAMPVFDRYTIVLQIFKEHACTKEAQLQVALAEIPYLRSRLRSLHEGNLDRSNAANQHIGGSGETFYETRKQLLENLEMKLRKEINDLRSHRMRLRNNRMNKSIPVVAVVGYTNAGKTSLIKAVTGETELQPKNHLFATLDVTVHAAILPNKMTALFVDTIGFISDIPTNLMESFTATLEDVRLSDVIIHVRDISHPDKVAQKENVIKTLANLDLPEELAANMIEVGNKVDLLNGDDLREAEEDTGVHLISAETGLGLHSLQLLVQERLIQCTGRRTLLLRVPMGGQAARWLYKESSVVSSQADEGDSQHMLLQIVITDAVYGKFQHLFGDMEVS